MKTLEEIIEDLAEVRRMLLEVGTKVQIVQSHIVERNGVTWQRFSTSVPVPGCTEEIAKQWNDAMEKRNLGRELQVEKMLIAAIESVDAKPLGLIIDGLQNDD